MNTILKLVAVVALVAVGQAMAQSTIDYTLTLGGDNHLADWENCTYPQYTYPNPNPDQNGQNYTVGDTVNWAAEVAVGGTHSGGLGDGLIPAGAANLVFSLQLVGPSGTVLLAAGGPSTQGWYSTINDGVDNAVTGCVPTLRPLEPLENAAFATVFNVGGQMAQGGRLFDADSSGGPGMDYYHYPSAAGRPSTAVVSDGGLHGMGAGYALYYPVFLGGTSTGGVGGWDPGTGDTTLCTALGKLPLFEGQINTSGLDAGSYTLQLNVEQGNNILPAYDGVSGLGVDCDFGSTGAFAVAANTVNPDTIQFNLATACTAPVINEAKSRKLHGATPYDIDLLATAPIQTECRSGPARQVVVTFNQAVVGSGTGGAGVPTDASVAPSGSVTGVSIAGAVVTVDLGGMATQGTTYTISFPGLKDACSGALAVSGTVSMTVRYGDTNNSNWCDVFDLVHVRDTPLNTPANGTNFRQDVNGSGSIDVFDLVAVRDAPLNS